MSEESNERRLVVLSSPTFSFFPQTRKEWWRGAKERRRGDTSGECTRNVFDFDRPRFRWGFAKSRERKFEKDLDEVDKFF